MDKDNIEAYFEKILTECKHWATDELHKLIHLLESFDGQFHLQPIYKELAKRDVYFEEHAVLNYQKPHGPSADEPIEAFSAV